MLDSEIEPLITGVRQKETFNRRVSYALLGVAAAGGVVVISTLRTCGYPLRYQIVAAIIAAPTVALLAYLRRQPLTVSTSEASVLLDSALSVKDRFSALVTVTEQSTNGTSVRGDFITRQLRDALPEKPKLSHIAPLTFSRTDLLTAAVAALFLLCAIGLYIFRPLSRLEKIAQAIQEIVANNPELPAPLQQQASDLAEQLKDAESYDSSEIQDSLNRTKDALDKALAASPATAAKGSKEIQEKPNQRESRSDHTDSARTKETPTPAAAGNPSPAEKRPSQKEQKPDQRQEQRQEPKQQEQQQQGQKEQAKEQAADSAKQVANDKQDKQKEQTQQQEQQQQKEQKQSQQEQQGGQGEQSEQQQQDKQSGSSEGQQQQQQQQQQQGQSSGGKQGQQGQQQGDGEGEGKGSSEKSSQSQSKSPSSGDQQGIKESSGKDSSSQSQSSSASGDKQPLEQLKDELDKAQEALQKEQQEQQQQNAKGSQGGSNKSESAQGEEAETKKDQGNKDQRGEGKQEKNNGKQPQGEQQNKGDDKGNQKQQQGQQQEKGNDKGKGKESDSQDQSSKQEQSEAKAGDRNQEKPNDEKQQPQSRQESSKEKTPPRTGSKSDGEESAMPDRNAAARPVPGGAEDSRAEDGLGPNKGFKESEIKDRSETFDPRFTGEQSALEKNSDEATAKTSIEDITLAKPKTSKAKGEQPIPLEYEEILE